MKMPEDKPPFRRIVWRPTAGAWLAYAGNTLRAKFFFESDAMAWRAADPLNSGTMGELMDREEQRD